MPKGTIISKGAKSNRRGNQAVEPWRNRIVGEGEEEPGQLLANPGNWRIHPKQQQDALSGVLDEVGWVQRILVNRQTGHVIDGHLRVSLAISRNEPTVPVVYVDLSPEEELVVLATLDPLSAMAGTDREKLEELMESVRESGLLAEDILDDIAGRTSVVPVDDGGGETDSEPDMDVGKELMEHWGTEVGQTWRVGEHLLIIGDSTESDLAQRIVDLSGKGFALAIGDPPIKIRDDDFSVCWMKIARTLSKKQIVFPGLRDLKSWLNLFTVYHVGVWAKQNTQDDGRVSQLTAWEPILFIGEDWPKDRQADIFDFASSFAEQRETYDHPEPKPTPLMTDLIMNYTRPGDLVYDPFAGSGTTMIACQNLKRKTVAVEISPEYSAIILQRMMDAFGIEGVKQDAEKAK